MEKQLEQNALKSLEEYEQYIKEKVNTQTVNSKDMLIIDIINQKINRLNEIVKLEKGFTR
jgi:hypothetical protein